LTFVGGCDGDKIEKGGVKMKKTNIAKIKKELANPKFASGCAPKRSGIEYGWGYAYGLDAAIVTRAKNARKWREKVLELAEMGTVYERKGWLRGKRGMKNFKSAKVYSVNGDDLLVVASGRVLGGANVLKLWTFLED
jgi:hypothetical protein